ncbi:MAG: TIGR01244 family sulfur transferase [Pseudomonadota bacterium]
MAIRLNDKITASGQITPADVAAINADGFTTVITVRPDGEMPGQPTADEIRAATEEAGLTHHFMPMTPGVPPSVEDAKAFAAAMENGPVFAYCGAGPRVVLFASCAGAVSGRPIEELVSEARDAGFDLSGAAPLLETFAAQAEG